MNLILLSCIFTYLFSSQVGTLIGKGGEMVRNLQLSSGAKIQIRRDSEADPNAALRPVEIIGSLASIEKAEKLINEVIAQVENCLCFFVY